MGYYTNYELRVQCDDENKAKKISDEIDRIGIFDNSLADIGASGDLHSWYWFAYDKWYEHERDMRILSTRIPGVVFTLHGDGEDSEDMWVEYYFNGHMQRSQARIVYDEFNINKIDNETIDGCANMKYTTE